MDINSIWEQAKSYIRQDSRSIVGYKTYLQDAVPISYNYGVFTLSVSTAISKNMIEMRYRTSIETALLKVTSEQVRLELVVGQEQAEVQAPEVEPAPVQQANSGNLNPRYTFENFVIGTSNEHAAALAMNVAKFPGQSNNPLFLYGNSGLGKTHLMQAIGNQILKTDPSKKVLYISSEQFTNDMTTFLRDKDMKTFRQRYRSIDVLLVDDVQFIEGKEGTQEEFFHTFNDLYLNNKQIVLTSDRKPRDLVRLEERLRTRFEWGPTTDIIIPNFETRIAILKKKAESQRIEISEEVLSFIAERIDSSVRELEGALLKIVSYAGISNKEIDIETTKYVLRSILPEDGIIKMTPKKIIERVCTYYNITVDEMIGPSKTKNIAYPRQIAMYLCKTMTDANFVVIAKEFGNRDRTTVMYGVDKIMSAIKTDPALKADIEYIKKDLSSL